MLAIGYSFIWDWAGRLRESEKYWTGRVKVFCFHIQSSEGGSPRLCRLRIDRAPVNKIDYVLAHTGFMMSRKLSSFNGRWVGRHPAVLHGWHWDSVQATHGLLVEVVVWKMTLGYGGPGSTLWKSSWKVATRGAFVAYVCHVSRLLPCKVILIQISVTPSDMGDACSLLSFCRSAISLCSHETYDYV
jgi:hypothetical protein